ncbi:MAG: serine/threonine-protein kinase [Isosphaeraceae bacterium]
MRTPNGPGPGHQAADEAEDSILIALLDELTAATRKGQAPDLEQAERRYPELAEDLRSLWATVWVAEEIARSDVSEGPRDSQGPDAKTVDWPAQGRSPDREPPPSPAPTRHQPFGEYDLLEEIGRGGMGIVSRAVHRTRNRVVALKRLLRGPDASAEDIERFLVETGAAGSLDHVHIVPVFELGECEGQPFFTMKYVEGTTLAKTLADGPLPAFEAARLLAPICRAIHYAHQCGVLHRDLKPSNILIDLQGNPYVSDFGLAKRIDVDPSLTPSGALVGTPSYMAPEQAGCLTSGRRVEVGPASDVYSLGAILYHMLTGRPPFQAATAVETILLALEHDPIPPRALNPRVSPDVEMIALKCLQKSPGLRYATAADLADDLEAFLRGDPVSARSTSLRALAARLLGETHHAPVLENWGSLWIYHSIALLVFFGITNWLYLDGVTARWPYFLIFTVGLCGWAAIFWALRRRGGPIRFVERQLAHVWGAGIVAINLVFLVEWLLGLPVLALAPMIAVTNGMLFMIKGGILSGGYYLQAAVTFLAIFPMAAFPRFAPIIFGVIVSACFFATGMKYRLRRLRAN